jgi:predicted metallopeptidase
LSEKESHPPDEKYIEDPQLAHVIAETLESTELLPYAQAFEIKAVFARGKAREGRESASCRRQSQAWRTVTGVDYLLVFWTDDWEAMTTERRHRTVVHELLHIRPNKNGDPGLRRHQGDFCEIEAHDKESADLAKKIPISPTLRKLPRQATLGETKT